jgi:hypothetical protein
MHAMQDDGLTIEKRNYWYAGTNTENLKCMFEVRMRQ